MKERDAVVERFRRLAGEPEPDLFEGPDRSRLRRLTAAVDKVRGKFGFDSVTSATILELRQRRPKR